MKIDNSQNLEEPGNASITAVLKSEYIGCTHPVAFNYNQMENGELCAGGVGLGGNQAEYCEILALSMPEFWAVDTSLVDQSFDIPISLINPQNFSPKKRPRSQDIKDKEYIENGCFYIFRRDNF